jgi:membrane glycosyltransferase
VGLETLVSSLLAPIMMAFHSTFVVSTLLGRSVRWEAPQRGEPELSLRQAARAHAGHTAVGLAVASLVLWMAPEMIVWLVPVLAGLLLSIPLSMALSDARLGRLLRARGLLLTEEESESPRVLVRQRRWLARVAKGRAGLPPNAALFQVALDPAFNALHIAILEATGIAEGEDARTEQLRQIATYGGPNRLTRPEKLALLLSAPALRRLHRDAWRQWPREVLDFAVDAAQRTAFG